MNTRLISAALWFLIGFPIALGASDLPPDPGKNGEQTLAGIDVNHNGVRDDVERYIGIHYLNSAKTRAALMQYALAMQEKMVTPINKVDPLEPRHKVLRAYDCLVYVVGNSSATKMMNELEGLVINTGSRMQAYLSDPPGPSGFDPYQLPQASERKRRCTFDPDALPD